MMSVNAECSTAVALRLTQLRDEMQFSIEQTTRVKKAVG
jgi:hypothetical protein